MWSLKRNYFIVDLAGLIKLGATSGLDPAPVCVTLSESIGRRWQLRSGHKAWTYFLFVTNTYRGKEGRRREVNKRLGEVGENGLKSLVVLMCMRCAK